MLPDFHPAYITVKVVDDVAVVGFTQSHLSEDHNIEALGRELFAILDQFDFRKIVVNLGGVEYITSAAVGKLITLHRKLHRCGGRLVLCGIAGPVVEILETTRLEGYFDVQADEAAAMSVLRDELVSVLVAIEGIDGTGKGTQAERLQRRLVETGFHAALMSFPRYRETLFGKAVGDFLNGRFGALREVSPFLASVLYAGDRFESRELLLENCRKYDAVVLDRYVASNIAHQGAKLIGKEREELIEWVSRIEYEVFALPLPNLVLLLDLPVSQARELISRKVRRAYTERSADLQEADAQYLENVRQLYLSQATQSTSWRTIACQHGDRLRTIEDIGEEIWSAVEPMLRE